MGKLIDNYHLTVEIGAGEFGKVYLAQDMNNQEKYAIKQIPNQKFKVHDRLQELTQNEITVLSKIKHPNIVMFYEIIRTTNNCYFVYEYCEGGTLEDLMKKKFRIPEQEALIYFKQILQGIESVVSQNILHRDLKPQNIMFKNGNIKIGISNTDYDIYLQIVKTYFLGDFGFCKQLDQSQQLANTMLGSPLYMAPEIILGQEYSKKADLWSIGVILYQMLYGKTPFQAKNLAGLISLIQTKEMEFDDAVQISDQTKLTLRRILTKDHNERISWSEIFEQYIGQSSISKRSSIDSQSILPSNVTNKNSFQDEEKNDKQAFSFRETLYIPRNSDESYKTVQIQKAIRKSEPSYLNNSPKYELDEDDIDESTQNQALTNIQNYGTMINNKKKQELQNDIKFPRIFTNVQELIQFVVLQRNRFYFLFECYLDITRKSLQLKIKPSFQEYYGQFFQNFLFNIVTQIINPIKQKIANFETTGYGYIQQIPQNDIENPKFIQTFDSFKNEVSQCIVELKLEVQSIRNISNNNFLTQYLNQIIIDDQKESYIHAIKILDSFHTDHLIQNLSCNNQMFRFEKYIQQLQNNTINDIKNIYGIKRNFVQNKLF